MKSNKNTYKLHRHLYFVKITKLHSIIENRLIDLKKIILFIPITEI